MPDPTPTQVPCPHCRADVCFSPVTVIQEGTIDIDRLFDGTLNQAHCDTCGKDFLFETPLVYRDDETRYLVYFLPRPMAGDLAKAIASMDQIYRQMFAEFDEEDLPTCRLTLQRSHFIEKIALHQFDYDDRLVEYVKLMLYQHNEGLDPIRHELLFDFGNTDEESINFFAYDREHGQAEYALGITLDDYRDLEESLFSSPDMQDELEGLFREHYVTVDDLLA